MNKDSYLAVFVALSCIAAAGMSAATLESTLSTDPDDVVELEYDRLPIGKDGAGRIEKKVQSNKNRGQSPATGTRKKQREERDPQPQQPQQSEKSGDAEAQRTGDGSESSSDPSSKTGESGGGGDGGESGGGGGSGTAPGKGVVESLLGLLRRLLALLVALALLALAYRYRDRLLALAAAIRGALTDDGDSRPDSRGGQWPTGRPSNEVREAWLSMVQRLDLDRPRARTPAECADAAVESDMNPEAVETLTGVFEEVRYGGEPVTEDRVERAREGLRRLDAGTGGGGPA